MREGQERFQGGHMHDKPFIKTDAPLQHVEQEARKKQRDRFGNRVFTSPELAYRDREGKETKSSLLVSEVGEQFLKENSGILKNLDRALQELSPTFEDRHLVIPKKRLDLGRGRSLEYLGQGAQSVVYKLQVNERIYIIKIHLSYSKVHQPYINEMLQIQSLQLDLKDSFQKLGVEFPQFLFASGQMTCVEFVPKEATFSEDFESTYYAAATISEDYIEEQKRKGVELWNYVDIDKVHPQGVPKTNFRERDDGSVVWIDPVAYFPTGGQRKPETRLSDREIKTLKPLSVQEMKEAYRLAADEVNSFVGTIMGFDDFDEVGWIEHAWEQIRKYGVQPYSNPDQIIVSMARVKAIILKKHNVRWIFET
ncbi:MAG: hypothetical protein UT30_C0011G0049 [Candidatus Uhrbacteria bacterium GW2011_GWF2_39_13]|uniref:Protein kinase domain-containing protein n=1 Tax=Candidatus Uhrbacteria bacterium GW2011_GWF2_39_13 TaxID=1618995 RepID=A0A0G0MM62_9BACT|nr:MAG: hypothetical protein UT30_C0011G0049 [Candidatus Uhrbacteria bacterium GW2011_GWF2_39_13]HAU66624.1 hypothetical protein [Candidatus Uhrbacteria bacterium]